MSSGAISVKVVPWSGKLPAFRQQFSAFVQQCGHSSGLKYKLRPGVIMTEYHDQDGIAKNTPAPAHLVEEDLTEEEIKSQIFVRSQLVLASDDPIWLSIFRKIPQSAKFCGADAFVAVLNRFAPASAGQRSKLRQKITNMSHVPPELAIDFVIRIETVNEDLKSLDDPGYTDGALADLILTKLHDVYDPLRNQIYARNNPEDLEAIRTVFVQQGPRFDALMESLKTPSSGAALAAIGAPSDAVPRRQLICWLCGGPHGKRDSREKGWQPCIEFCKAAGKPFRPPGPPGQPRGVAAIAASAGTVTNSSDNYDIPPVPLATGIGYTIVVSQDICDIPDDAYAIDCAASFTMTAYMADLPENHIVDNAQIFGLGHSGTSHSRSIALGQFKLTVLTANNSTTTTGNIPIRCVPDLVNAPIKRLISLSETMRLCGWRYIFNGTDDSSIIINNKIIPLTYAPECGLFYIRPAQQGVSLFSYTKATPDKNLWHLRLGHLGISTMDKTVKAPGITGMTFASGDVDHFCEVCASSKARAEALNRALCDIRSLNCMERLQWDLWGPLPVVSYGGTRYVSSMVCMASGVGILLNVAFKDEAYDQHLKLVITTANLYGHTIKTIRSDNDRSLVDNNSSKQIMLDNKITAELTGRDNHHRIGAAERRWQTLHSMSLSMLRHAGIGLEFMAYAIHAANYILNRVWQDNKQCIPFAKLTNVSSVDLSHLRVFGCPCYVHIDPSQRKKFENQTVKGIFVGYYNVDGDYLVWNPETKRTIHSRSVQFQENWKPIGDPSAGLATGLPHWTPAHQLQRAEPQPVPAERNYSVDSVIKRITDDDIIAAATSTPTTLSTPPTESTITTSTVDTTDSPDITDDAVAVDANENYDTIENNDVSPVSSEIPVEPPLRRSSRSTVRHDYRSGHARGFGLTAIGAHHGIGPVPKTSSQAFRSSECEQWRAARDDEIASLHSKQVFGPPILLPAGKHAVPIHFVFDRKYNKDGTIKKHKARAVAAGNRQIQGIDYSETFAPCTRFATFRLFFAIVAATHLTTASFDVKTAYLNAGLEEEVYVMPPPVFPDESLDPAYVGKVFRLQRALYGLRQAGREWFLKLLNTMKSLGFEQSLADPGIYTKRKNGSFEIMLIVYVDDIIAAGHGEDWILPLHHQLSEHFEITHDGEATWCLGTGIDHNPNGSITLHQSKYIDDMLNNFNMIDANPATTPMAIGFDDNANSPPVSKDTPYASLVGSLNYASVCTRPDISYAVSLLCKHLKNPTQNHWQAAKRVLRYLKGTKHYGLNYEYNASDNCTLSGYCDASYASTHDARSISGSCFLFSLAAVLWSSSTQKAVSASTAEAEYYSLGTAGQDAMFLRELLSTMGFPQVRPTIIFEDNTACLAIANNPITSKKARHIKVKYHYIRQLIDEKEVCVKYKSTDDMLADIFTKPLDVEKHLKFTRLIMNIKD